MLTLRGDSGKHCQAKQAVTVFVLPLSLSCESIGKRWSIGTRVVWHLLRVSPGAPTNLACEGRVACLNGLVRGACLPRFVEAALCTHTHPAAFVAGARQAPVGRTALDEWVSPTKATRTRG